MIEIIFDYRKISYIFCIYQFVIVNLNLFYSPSNLIFLLWFQFLIISFGKKYLLSLICMSHFFSRSIHHPTSTEIVVQTTQKNQEEKDCLFTVVQGIPHSCPLFPPLLPVFLSPETTSSTKSNSIDQGFTQIPPTQFSVPVFQAHALFPSPQLLKDGQSTLKRTE